jgi:hypothetical protein
LPRRNFRHFPVAKNGGHGMLGADARETQQ